MQEVLTGNGRTTALLLALGLLALPARGIEFGEIEVLSPLGEKLDARIPLRARTGEWFHVTCIALAPPAGSAAIPGVAGGTLSVERRRDSANLRLRTTEPVNDPALAFGITSTCAGATTPPVAKQFSVLLDPPEALARQRARARPAPAARPAAVPPAPAATQARTRPAPPAAAATAPAPAPAATPPARDTPPAPRPAPPDATAASSGRAEFVLKLTSAPIDLQRTQHFDDKSRALLRERLRLLDSDDQVAAMLSMRDNLRRLEARVAELQLKLATTTAPADSTQRRTGDPAPVAPKVEPPVLPTAPPPAAMPPPVARLEPPAAPTPANASTPGTAPKPAPASKTSPPPAQSETDFLASLPGGLAPWAIGLAALLVLATAWLFLRRRREPAEELEAQDHLATTMLPRHELAPAQPPSPVEEEQPFEVAPPVRPELASDAVLATRLEEDTESLRRRYIEERIPEIRDGTIVLDDPGSVVKGARLFYEDGAIPKAVELLSFAIEDRPAEIRPWLALFEIYRLERLTGEFSDLAARFRDRHGAAGQWAKVRGLGRELDPPNPLYQEPPAKPLETIGPREARRLAAAHFDPLAENWLEASMDFENEVLATELRRALMARAKVEDRDLVPNPMPALRSVEMFSVG